MTPKECGRFIAELRKEKNITQKQLAEKLNVSDKAVSRWETGKGFPDVNLLVLLSEFFEVSVNELLAGKRVDKDILPEIAERNVIEAVETKEKTVKKKNLQMALCILVFIVMIIPPVIPAIIYIADNVIMNFSFENATEFIVLLLVAVLFLASGFAISRGHISLLHSYHYRNVVDRESYCKDMGKTTMLMSIPAFISSFTVLFPAIEFVEVFGTCVLGIGLFIGCAFLFKYQYKYNGGLF